ncbi:hypothetical protein PBRA_008944 [Plasmodiophora brassicae]|nr:hypothetical protein PBRA_008944 [Plasmodiophora brassicae]
MSSVFDGGNLRGFLAGLFGGPDNIETLPENTWLRLKGRGDVTIEHADYFYFKRSTDMFERYATDDEKVPHDGSCGACGRTTGSMVHCGLCTRGWHTSCMDASARPSGASSSVSTWHCSSCADGPLSVFTCWCALGDIDLQDSTLAFVPGTHTLTGYDRPRAGEQVPSSFKGGSARWHVADGTLRPGDIFIFNVKTIHCASKNGTTRFRASLDTRVELTRPGRRAWPRLVAEAAPQLK